MEKTIVSKKKKIISTCMIVFALLFMTLSTGMFENLFGWVFAAPYFDETNLSPISAGSVSDGGVFKFDINQKGDILNSTVNLSEYAILDGTEVIDYYPYGGKGVEQKDGGTGTVPKFWFTGVKSSADGKGANPLIGTPLTQNLSASTLFFDGNLNENAVVSTKLIENVNVISATGTARYSVAFKDKGTYTVYFYSPSGEKPVVNYVLIDSDEAANELEKPTLELSPVDNASGWYKGNIPIEDLYWSVVKFGEVVETVNNNNAQDNIAYPGAGSTTTYCYNDWSNAETVNFSTVLTFEFTDCSLGPVCKQGKINFENKTDDNGEPLGTVEFLDMFGNPVKFDNCDYGKITVITEAKEGTENAFLGFGSSVDLVSLSETTFLYNFQQSEVNLIADWDIVEVLGNIGVSVNGEEIGDHKLSFTSIVQGSHTSMEDVKTDYTFTFKPGVDTAVNKISYEVRYTDTNELVPDASGTGTFDNVKNGASFTLPVYWKSKVVITFTTDSGKSVSFVYTFNKTPFTGEFDPVAKVVKPDKTETNYKYIEDALIAANSGDTIEILKDAGFVNEYELRNPKWRLSNNEGYVVKSGVNFVIPYAAGSTDLASSSSSEYPYANRAEGSGASNMNPATDKFLTLTIPSDITLYVNGVFAVGGTISGTNAPAGATKGAHSNVQLDGNIVLNGVISSCGYILGNGTITANYGAKIYQPLIVVDYNGGGYTVSAAGSDMAMGYKNGLISGEKYVSPFMRYTLLNVQANIKMVYGSYIFGYCCLEAGDITKSITGCLIGDSGSTPGVIKLKSGASAEVEYDEGTFLTSSKNANYKNIGRTIVDVKGGASLGSLELEVKVTTGIGGTMNTKDLAFPIPYNYEIKLNNGTYDVGSSLNLMPGCIVYVGEEGILNLSGNGTKITVFDGLFDHMSSPQSAHAAVALGNQKNAVAYPTPAMLQASGMSATANLIVDGKLDIGSGVIFGGVIQTNGKGTVTSASDSNLTNCTTQVWLAGTHEIKALGLITLKTYHFSGGTIRTLPAQVMDATTGKRTDLVAGIPYNPHENSYKLDDYKFTVYLDSENLDLKNENVVYKLGDNGQAISGSWYNYIATIKNVTSGSEIQAPFCIGADVTDGFKINGSVNSIYLFSDPACTEEYKLTDLSDLAEGKTYYTKCDDHKYVVNDTCTALYCPNCGFESGTIGIDGDMTITVNANATAGTYYYVTVATPTALGTNKYLFEQVTNSDGKLVFTVTDFTNKVAEGSEVLVFEDRVAFDNIIKLRGFQVDGSSLRLYNTIRHDRCTVNGTAITNYEKIELQMQIVHSGASLTSGVLEQKQVYNYLYNSSEVFSFEDAYVFSLSTDLAYFAGNDTLTLNLAERIYTSETEYTQYVYSLTITLDGATITSVEMA